MFLLALPTSTSSAVAGRLVRENTCPYAFVTARVDYCNMVLTGAPRSVTDTRVAAARLVSGMRKHDRGLSQLLDAD